MISLPLLFSLGVSYPVYFLRRFVELKKIDLVELKRDLTERDHLLNLKPESSHPLGYVADILSKYRLRYKIYYYY